MSYKNIYLKRNIFIIITCIVGGLSSCRSVTDRKIEVTLTNTTPYKLNDKAISINRTKFSTIPEGQSYPLLVTSQGDTIPAQLDDLTCDKKWDELFFVMDLPANTAKKVNLEWAPSPIKFQKRTSVRFGVRPSVEDTVRPATVDTFRANQLPWIIGYQRYQTDGPTWENDKVGFRLYLDGRNSVDVFGKKVSYMTPRDVGINHGGVTEDTYASMQKWGKDILGVGNSVGLGGVALMLGDKLARLGVTENDTINNVKRTIFRILTEGPARSAVHLNYSHWHPLNRDYSVDENISIWPGMYAFKNSVSIEGLQGDETLLIGLVNSNTDKPLNVFTVNKNWIVLSTHDKQTVDKKRWLGLALILPKKSYLGYFEAPEHGEISNTILAKMKIHNNMPINYYAIACWELSNESFRNSDYFKKYLTNLVYKIDSNIKVKATVTE